MRILFATGHGYFPEINGGVQSSTDHLARQCQEAGHTVAVLAALYGDGLFGLKARVKLKLARQGVCTDRHCGYPVMRAWFPWEATEPISRSFRPDVALVECHRAVRIGKALAEQRIPLVVYLRNVEYRELAGDPRELPSAAFIANSRFTAEQYRRRFGIESTVIPPTIERTAYETPTTNETVTFINMYPEKGFDLALAIAKASPEIPFLFVESWKLDPDHLARVQSALRPCPNITFLRRTDHMQTIYGRTRILLAPSQWEEAWGRVASEAHCSGIPVIGSNRGGLPEAIGPGGIVLDPEAPLEAWVGAVRDLWSSSERHAALSAAARRYAERAELNLGHQLEAFLRVLEKAALRNHLPSAP